MNKHRDILIKTVIENIKRESVLKTKIIDGKKNQSCPKEKCDLKFPVCLNDMDKEFQRRVVSFVVLKLNKTSNLMIDDYFGGQINIKVGKKTNSLNEYEDDDIVIERRRHTCGILEDCKTKSSVFKYNSNHVKDDLDLNDSLRKKKTCKKFIILIILSFKIFSPM